MFESHNSDLLGELSKCYKFFPYYEIDEIKRIILSEDTSNKKYVMKYTTVGGVDGFDGTRKEAPKAVVKAIQ